MPLFTVGVMPSIATGINWLLVMFFLFSASLIKFVTRPLLGMITVNSSASNLGYQNQAYAMQDHDFFEDEELIVSREINPATGLEMEGDMDIAGNSFGVSHDSN